MAKKMHQTPMLDQLESGPWPSFVTGLKRLAKTKDMAVDVVDGRGEEKEGADRPAEMAAGHGRSRGPVQRILRPDRHGLVLRRAG